MPTPTSFLPGAPCWTDLWTSDVDGSRRFYAELFGWEAAAPSAEFGGYFMFLRDGVPVAGGMGDMGDMTANDRWKIYLATTDIAATASAAATAGAVITAPASPVADLGEQCVLLDPAGAVLGAWQAGTFPGFSTVDEPGSPGWFELYTKQYSAALAFYENVFTLSGESIGDTDDFRYSVLRTRGEDREVAGIMDARDMLGPDEASYWVTYWQVDDVDRSIETVRSLGGHVSADATDSPHGRIAGVTDHTGAPFRLISAPA